MSELRQAYADIHYYEASDDFDPDFLDDDGDPLQGWYFQLIEDGDAPLTALIGPYGDRIECEEAAAKEWNSL